ncbi:MAG: hypothetical protein ABW190_11655 [Rhizobacter sp.]
MAAGSPSVNSWLHLQAQDPRYQLPLQLAAQDPMAAQDCGWVEQMLPFIHSHASPQAWIVDPFCGFGSTLVAASIAGVRAVGVELDAQRSQIARQRLDLLGLNAVSHPVLTGSVTQPEVRERLRTPSAGEPPRRFSLCLTNVPYFGCSGQPGDASAGQLYAEPFYAPYLQGLRDVFFRVHELLEPEGWGVVMVQNLRLGNTFVPLAWDVARLLAERFVLHEERVLVYDRASSSGAPPTGPTNRAHEYALVFRKQAAGMDPMQGRELLAQLHREGFEFAVYGSFARWLATGTPATPGDIDLLCPPDDAEVSHLLQWLEAQGFAITSWDTPVRPPVSTTALAHRHYFRARRLHRNGTPLQVDVTLVADREAFDAHLATCREPTPHTPYAVLAVDVTFAPRG